MRGQEEAAAAAAGVRHGIAGPGSQAAHHGSDQRTGREILARAALGVLGVLLQQALVDFALHVGGHGDPLLLVDHLHHAIEYGGVADLVGGLHEDLAKDARLPAQCVEDLLVLLLQGRAGERVHVRPAAARRDAGFAVVGRAAVFVAHLQKDHVGELFQIILIGHAIVPQGIAHAPDFGDDGGGGVRHNYSSFLYFSTGTGTFETIFKSSGPNPSTFKYSIKSCV